ncbi:carboxylesterase/lipase family protein [Microvirga thermotolerans]|uniref:Carboxylic ester hydrolase n=1 Tax=Microvirga thermotolerans TaxID=2651334 RepID=A0A5P9JXQ3_9HYPH|nr:carboxylesterase family protein [Microvirga thermotolerans]QFU17213.1 carboxylesterase family protein [Microvirga thermotolerans]
MSKRALPLRLLTAATLVLSGSLGAFAAGETADPSVVATAKGAVRGTVRDGVREFKGIPYAKPPVGDARWSLPEPAQAWTGTLDATSYKSACPQPQRYDLKESSDDEDCLYLNVTVPDGNGAGPAGRKRPVLVWIHGGAFVGGSSALYPLAHLAKAGDVVVVSMNYRLGVFGFMAHPAFDADRNGGYGLEDQRLALRWVRENIAAFGGDPDNVTIAGESAGGAGVCMHLLAPEETSGLFHKAIVSSAGCVTPLPDVAKAVETGRKVAAEVGCGDGASALACMRGKPVKDLLAAQTKVAGSSIVTFMPVVGTRTVPLPGSKAIPQGKFVKVPAIMGGTRDELRLYVAYAMQTGQSFTKDNYADVLKETYGANTDAVVAQYPVSAYSSAPSAVGTVWSDFRADVGINNCIYLETSKLLRKTVPVYQFVFADRDAPPVTTNPGFEMGAVHSSELPYLFPHYDNTAAVAGPDLSPASQDLADRMVAYFTSFARTGTPSAPGSPAWEAFTADDKVLNLAPGRIGHFDAGAAHKCGFWKSLYPEVLTQ